MELEQPPPSYPPQPNLPAPEGGNRIKKAAGPLAVVGAILLKFKTALFAIFKFLPFILKTGGTMLLSIWVYTQMWGWQFAVGFVVLIFVHECGHLIAAKRIGLKVGAPMFIPFVGALIALKEAPRNAWIEAQVGIGGPLLGTVGAVACYGLYLLTGNVMFSGLAYTGFLINLFNLSPFGFLDGGRIVTALSPWLWVVGMVVIGALMFWHFNFLLLIIVIFSLPRMFSLFRKKSVEEKRYFEVTSGQRWTIGILYFGLIIFLVLGMFIAHVQPDNSKMAGGLPMKKFIVLPRSFYQPSAAVVADKLLGHWLVRQTPEGPCGGPIVETEAYLSDDPASHSFIGRTKRNRVMWDESGHCYAYFIYGNHWCCNAVCGPVGVAEAVLIRAIDPVLGLDLMRGRRVVEDVRQLTNGPGKLCAAMGIDGSLDGADLCDANSPLFIARNQSKKSFFTEHGPVVIGSRIGITKAAALLLRFYFERHPHVSGKNISRSKTSKLAPNKK